MKTARTISLNAADDFASDGKQNLLDGRAIPDDFACIAGVLIQPRKVIPKSPKVPTTAKRQIAVQCPSPMALSFLTLKNDQSSNVFGAPEMVGIPYNAAKMVPLP
jgi:hypothetical protein